MADELQGTVTLNGSGVSGATVFVIDDGNDSVHATASTDSNGDWAVDAPIGTYHIAVQYDDGSGSQYNAMSKPYVSVESTLPAHIPTTVTHYWAVDEGSGSTAADHPEATAGTAMDMSLSGTFSWQEDAGAHGGWQIDLDGTDGAIVGADQASVNPGAGEGFTLYAEVVQDTATGTADAYISKGDMLTGTLSNGQFGICHFSGDIWGEVYADDRYSATFAAPSHGSRYRYALRYEHGTTLEVWQAGSMQAEDTSASGDVNNYSGGTPELSLGVERSSYYLDGQIAEAAYFDHALTDSEMSTLTDSSR